MKKITYYKQTTDYTCGPAVMKMALSTLNIKKTEKQVCKLMSTTSEKGTANIDFAILAEKLKLNYQVLRNANLNNLKELLVQNYIIIIGYYIKEADTGHYAILSNINSKYTYLIDPFYGENYKLNTPKFKKSWKKGFKYDKDSCWVFVIKYK